MWLLPGARDLAGSVGRGTHVAVMPSEKALYQQLRSERQEAESCPTAEVKETSLRGSG